MSVNPFLCLLGPTNRTGLLSCSFVSFGFGYSFFFRRVLDSSWAEWSYTSKTLVSLLLPLLFYYFLVFDSLAQVPIDLFMFS